MFDSQGPGVLFHLRPPKPQTVSRRKNPGTNIKVVTVVVTITKDSM